MPHLLLILAVLAVIAVIVYAVPIPPRFYPAKLVAYVILAVAAIYFLLKFAGIA